MEAQHHNPIDLPPQDAATAYIERPKAGFWIRFVANFIDQIFLAIVSTGASLVWLGISDSAELTAPDLFFLAVLYLMMFTYAVVGNAVYGATFGKMAMGLRVQHRETGQNLTWGEAIVRQIGFIISCAVLYIGLIWAAFDKRKEGWHDKMASSSVVRVRK